MKRVVVGVIVVLAVLGRVPARAAARPLVPSATPRWQLDPSTPVACSDRSSNVRRIQLTVQGQRTYGYVAAPAGSPRGLVVFDHGYQQAADSYLQHLHDTASRDGVLAVAMDNRGSVDQPRQAGSAHTSTRGWRVVEGAEDSIAVAQLLVASCPVLQRRPIAVYGVSMGGNTSGLVVAARAVRAPHVPLFDWWFDIEGATNVIETYGEAVADAGAGNPYAMQARADIEQEMGGTLVQQPAAYQAADVVLRTADIAASGVRGAVIVHGAIDGLVPVDQSRELIARLSASGVRYQSFTALTRRPVDPSGTTLDTDAAGALPGGAGASYRSPFAGHADEARDPMIMDLGLARLAALFATGRDPGCPGEYVIDGRVHNPPRPSPDPDRTGC